MNTAKSSMADSKWFEFLTIHIESEPAVSQTLGGHGK